MNQVSWTMPANGQRATIPAGQASALCNGALMADCPFHNDGRRTLGLYPDLPRPMFHCFGCGTNCSFAASADGSYELTALW